MLKCRITIVVHLLRFPVICQDIFMALMMTTCPLHLFMIYLHYRSLVKLTLHHLLQWNQHLQDHFPAQPILKIPRLISHFNVPFTERFENPLYGLQYFRQVAVANHISTTCWCYFSHYWHCFGLKLLMKDFFWNERFFNVINSPPLGGYVTTGLVQDQLLILPQPCQSFLTANLLVLKGCNQEESTRLWEYYKLHLLN